MLDGGDTGRYAPRPAFARWHLIGGFLLILAACGPSFPLGMTEAEWQALSPEQQLQARQQQASIDAERQRQREVERAARAAEAAAAERAERERVERIIAQRVPGSVIDCAIEGGEVRFRFLKAWIEPEPVAFTIVRSERRAVDLASPAKQGRANEIRPLWVVFDDGARQLALCPFLHAEPTDPTCRRIALLGSEIEGGFARRLDMPDVIRNATLRCENAVPADSQREIIIRG